MPAANSLVEWCQRQRAIFEYQVHKMRLGVLRTSELRGISLGPVDTTTETIEHLEKRIARLDEIMGTSTAPR